MHAPWDVSQCARWSLRALCQAILPAGRTSSLKPSTMLLERGWPATGCFNKLLPEGAEHVRGACADMTIGGTSLL